MTEGKLLEPVATDTTASNHDQEYHLPDDEEGYLKLNFQDERYNISWHTDESWDEFVAETCQILSDTKVQGQLEARSDGKDVVVGLYSGGLSSDGITSNPQNKFRETPRIVKYKLETEEGSSLEIDWFEFSRSPRVSVTAGDFDFEERFEKIFEQTLRRDHDIHDAYNEAVERARDRLGY